MDIGPLCFRACSSILLVHPEGGNPGDARVLNSYTGMVFGYAGSFRYDRAPRFDWGRRQVVTALSVHCNSYVSVGALPNLRVRCRSSCKDIITLTVAGSGHSL